MEVVLRFRCQGRAEGAVSAFLLEGRYEERRRLYRRYFIGTQPNNYEMPPI